MLSRVGRTAGGGLRHAAAGGDDWGEGGSPWGVAVEEADAFLATAGLDSADEIALELAAAAAANRVDQRDAIEKGYSTRAEHAHHGTGQDAAAAEVDEAMDDRQVTRMLRIQPHPGFPP